MKSRKQNGLTLWVIGNIILITMYFGDMVSIKCEPCAPNTTCPPCSTSYMDNFFYILAGWNLIFIVITLILRRKKG